MRNLLLAAWPHDPSLVLAFRLSECGLHEWIGGEHNWDYRYTWIRDAAFTIYALLRLASTDEAAGFMDWNQPDEGIGEVRGGRRHFVYSKLQCWVALDRGLRLA